AVWKAHTPSGTVTNVYTGQVTNGRPQVQGSQYNAGHFSSLAGSPQTDGDATSANGAAVTVDAAHMLLLQANQYSGQIAWYALTAGSPGVVGSMTYKGDTQLAE